MSLSEDLKKRVVHLDLMDCQVIMVKEPYLCDRLRGLKIKTKNNINVLVVNDFEDLKTLNDKQLTEAGLQRVK